MIQLLVFGAILILINILSSAFFTRIDLTEQKRFSLSEPTRELVRNLDDIVTVSVYLSSEQAGPNVARLEKEALELLDQLRSYGGVNLEYQIEDPTAFDDEDLKLAYWKELFERGMPAIEYRAAEVDQASYAYIFPYAEVNYQDREPEVVYLLDLFQPFIEPSYDPASSISLLEYRFSSAIRKLVYPDKPRIAFIYGQNEFDTTEVFDASRALSEFYQVERFNLNGFNQLDTGYSAIIIAGSTESFSKVNKFKIDQYLMRGGRIMWLLDGVVANFDSLNIQGEMFTRPYYRNVEDMLFAYGARINADLIQDLQSARIAVPLGGDQYERRPWCYEPILNNFNQNHPITSHLPEISADFASTIDTVAVPGLNKTILVRSSANSRVMRDPVRLRIDMVLNPPAPDLFDKKDLPIAVLIEGNFTSAFKTLKLNAEAFVSKGVGADEYLEEGLFSKMIVISDADIIRTPVDQFGRRGQLGNNLVEERYFANLQFIVNCVEYLSDDSGLMSTRSKQSILRPLNPQTVKEQQAFWQMMNIVAPLLILFFLGGVYNVIRYRRFAMK